MAPDSHCLNRVNAVPSHSFMTRVWALPTLGQAATLYNATKEQHYVGVVLRMAERGVRTVAATGALIPLAKPIANHVVDGWGSTVDDWACQWLDNMVKVAPIITKPPDEIVNDTHHFVMRSLAGQPFVNPLTFKSALSARASYMVERASSSNYGRMIVDITDSLLHTAHVAVDTYLPADEGDLHHADGSEGDISTKAIALADKTQARLRRSAKKMLANYEETNDDDDVVIYPLHLVETEYRSTPNWYSYIQDNFYVNKVSNATVAVQSTLVKTTGAICKIALKGSDLVCTSIRHRGGKAVSLVIAMAVNVGSSTALYGTHLGHSIGMAGVRAMQDITYNLKETTHSSLLMITNVNNAIMGGSWKAVKAFTSNGTNMALGTMSNGMMLFQTVGRVGMNMTRTVTKGLHTAMKSIKEQGTNSYGLAKEHTANVFRNVLHLVPTPLSSMVCTLYSQLLSTSRNSLQYREHIYQTTYQVLDSTRQLPKHWCLWISNTQLLIDTQLFLAHFKRRLTAFLKEAGLPGSEESLTVERTLQEVKNRLEMFAAAFH